MSDKLVLIFDTETTGIPNFSLPADAPSQPRLASVAAMLVTKAGEEVESFYDLIVPDWTEEQIARAANAFSINGLSIERLAAEGKPLAAVLDAFEALHAKAAVISAYGLHFDTKMVRGELRRSGRPDLYGLIPGFCVQRACTELCKMPATKAMVSYGRGNQFKTPKLAEAGKILLGEDIDGAHDAMVDLRMTRRIFAHLSANGHVKPRAWKMEKATAE